MGRRMFKTLGRTPKSLAAVLAVALLAAGCADESRAPPVSTSNGPGPASQMPQSPNSLPLGSAVEAPLDRSQVNRVRVP